MIDRVKSHYGGHVDPGDVFIVNDPYLGGTHLMDVRFVKPFFYGGRLFAWLANTGHWTDVGGGGGSPANAGSRRDPAGSHKSQSLQPWQFFVLAALMAATAATFMLRVNGIAGSVLLTAIMFAAALVGAMGLRMVRPLFIADASRVEPSTRRGADTSSPTGRALSASTWPGRPSRRASAIGSSTKYAWSACDWMKSCWPNDVLIRRLLDLPLLAASTALLPSGLRSFKHSDDFP